MILKFKTHFKYENNQIGQTTMNMIIIWWQEVYSCTNSVSLIKPSSFKSVTPATLFNVWSKACCRNDKKLPTSHPFKSICIRCCTWVRGFPFRDLSGEILNPPPEIEGKKIIKVIILTFSTINEVRSKVNVIRTLNVCSNKSWLWATVLMLSRSK